MRTEREGRKLKELFQRLRRDDERRAPPFIGILEAAATRNEKTGRYRFVLRVAATALALFVASWIFLFKRSTSTPPLPAPPLLVERGPAPAPIKLPLRVSPARTPLKRAWRRPGPSQPSQIDIVISRWRSPTDFLLRTPGEQWLKTVPQIGAPLAGIETAAPDQKN